MAAGDAFVGACGKTQQCTLVRGFPSKPNGPARALAGPFGVLRGPSGVDQRPPSGISATMLIGMNCAFDSPSVKMLWNLPSMLSSRFVIAIL